MTDGLAPFDSDAVAVPHIDGVPLCELDSDGVVVGDSVGDELGVPLREPVPLPVPDTVTVGDTLFAGASGQVGPAGTVTVGKSLTTADTNGAIIEFIPKNL